LQVLATAREIVVGERRVRADEYVVLECHPIPQLHPAFHGHSVADADVVLYEDVITYVAILADHGAWENMREGPYPASRSHATRLDDGEGMAEILLGRLFRHVDVREGISTGRFPGWLISALHRQTLGPVDQ
jgi:hypothetical protein